MFNRIKMIFQAIGNAFLGRQEDKYTREMLDLSYDKLLEQLQKFRAEITTVATSKMRVKRMVENGQADVLKLEEQARQFLAAGDEENARDALGRKAVAEQQYEQMHSQLVQLEAKQEELQHAEKELDSRISMFKSEKEVLKARHTAAKATAQMGEQITGITSEAMNVGQMIGRVKERTEELEARGAAIGELVEAGTLEEAFASDTNKLDRAASKLQRESRVESEFARLTAELSSGKKKQEIGA